MNKMQVITALRAFIAQRSGIDGRNYGGSREAFMGDYRPILRAGRDARILLAAVSGRDGITVENILAATRVYSGRLQIKERDGGAAAVEYTTGQYFPTEYRNAACAVLSSALWDYARAQGYDRNGIRKWARDEFGRGIANRWFN